MTEYVTCTVCGEEVGKMGIAKHSGMHKREFKRTYGRLPEDYDEVREKMGSNPEEETSLGRWIE